MNQTSTRPDGRSACCTLRCGIGRLLIKTSARPTVAAPYTAPVQAISTQLDTLTEDAAVLRDAIARARAGLVDREIVAEIVALCAVAGEHLLVIGPPGTAKSGAGRRRAAQLGGG